MPVSASEAFYLMLPILHALGGLLATGLLFGCDTGKGQQTPRVPRVVPGYTDSNFIAAYPWEEDNEFYTHTWNPFALIFLFEWLTAGFALRPLAYFFNGLAILRTWLLWLFVGLVIFIIWTTTNSGGPCVAMLLIGIFSFLISAMMAVAFFSWEETFGAFLTMPATGFPYKSCAISDKNEHYTDACGRTWLIPGPTARRGANLRQKRIFSLQEEEAAGGNSEAVTPSVAPESVTQGNNNNNPAGLDIEIELGVAIRYAEYCITAPLLFLAVVCFLTIDGPAWLYLTGYWLLVVCNALGIVLHFNFILSSSKTHEDKGGLLPWIFDFFFAGPWDAATSNQTCILQAAWFSLLLPILGLVFVIRGYLFSSQLPLLAQFMIWNLLLTYSLFGIVPTFVYMTRLGTRSLPWLLDILNVAAKFPLPLIILSGFIMRPATTKFCYN